MSEEIKVWMPLKGYKDDNLGECIFVANDFVTFVTAYPPAALRVQGMWDNGWEIYVQPALYRWVNANKPEESYITTYKRRTLK